MIANDVNSVVHTEHVFVNVQGAQEPIPRNRFRQAGNRFLGFLKDLQIRDQDNGLSASSLLFGSVMTRVVSWPKWSCKLYLKGKVLLIPDNTEF
jgi:hypothetical protein